MIKRIAAVCTTVVLALGIVGITATAAGAEDSPPPEETTIVAPEVIEEPTPEVVPEPPVEEVAPFTALVNKPEGPPEPPKKVLVCKYVGTPGVDEELKEGKNPIEVNENSVGHGWPGTFPYAWTDAHDHSLVIGYVGDEVVCPAPQGAPDPHYAVIIWAMEPSGETPDFDPDQTIVDSVVGLSAPDLGYFDELLVGKCAAFQVDVYHYDEADGSKAEVDALIAGGVLYEPDNPSEPLISGGLGTAWKFYVDTECAVEPVPCEAVGPWYTEDVAPVVTEDGLLFAGPSVPAINWLYVTTGNLQGIPVTSYTIASASDYHAAYRFVVNPHEPGLTYASVTAEPYINGWAPGQTGTFVIDQTTLVWSSKIVSGPGSQSEPVPLGDFGTIWPDNTLISQGFHLGSNSPEGRSTVISQVTGCLNESFVPPKPNPESGQFTKEKDPDCEAGTVKVVTFSWIKEPVWDSETHSWVLGPKQWSKTVEYREARLEECPPEVIEYLPPTSTDVCGTDKDTISVPADTEFVTYTREGNTVTATAAEGYALGGDLEEGFEYTKEWTFTFTNVACPTPPLLAFTGANLTPLGIGLGVMTLGLLLAAGAALYRRAHN